MNKPIHVRVGCAHERHFINEEFPSISWQIESSNFDVRMESYELELYKEMGLNDLIFTTGEVICNNPTNIQWPTTGLTSRQILFLRVRVRCNGEWGSWSDLTKIEASLLKNSDWKANFITNPDDCGREDMSPLPLFLKHFFVQGEIQKARIYVTALGLFDIEINGKRISENFLEPGWVDYRYELPVVTHDVTNLLEVGMNSITVILGDGWYRGKIGWEAIRNLYGKEVGLLLQLEYQVEDQTYSVYSDESWLTSFGEYQYADIYDGCSIDFRKKNLAWRTKGYAADQWQASRILDFPKVNLVPTEVPPVTCSTVLKATRVESTSKSGQLFKIDRNITGWVVLTVRGKEGSLISVKHAEVLDDDGNLYTRNLRKANATDVYVLPNEEIAILEPIFTFHGFQFFEVIGEVEVVNADVKVIHSNLFEISHFNSSNTDLNRLFQNIKNSQQANFISIPTDCPQRDERLGWTGDIQTFSRTAVNLFDCEYFLKSWLRQLSYSQRSSGSVTSVVPDVLAVYEKDGHESTGVMGWGDAATIVPWNLFRAYGNRDHLKSTLPAMVKWVNYLDSRVAQSGLIEDENGQLGDWLDPDAPHGYPGKGKTETLFIVNAFYSYSARMISKAFEVLGNHVEAEKYLNKAREVARKCFEKWQSKVLETSTGCAIAIEFNLIDDELVDKIGNQLAKLVLRNEGRATYGLVGTGRVLPALSKAKKWDAAFTALFNEECPGWLYQVKSGATTVWERWDGILPDGSIDEEPHYWKGEDVGMNSFNHYHLGSIGDWIMEHVGGIGLIEEKPGYASIMFAPRMTEKIEWCETRLHTPHGLARIDWRKNENGFSGVVEIPPGRTGILRSTFDNPATISINKEYVHLDFVELGSGQYEFDICYG